MNPEGSLGLDQSMYRARRSGCPGKTDDLLVIPIPEGTALSGEKHRTTCFNKIVTNPSRSHPVSLLCQIPCQLGNLRPLTASCPVLGFVFSTSPSAHPVLPFTDFSIWFMLSQGGFLLIPTLLLHHWFPELGPR